MDAPLNPSEAVEIGICMSVELQPVMRLNRIDIDLERFECAGIEAISDRTFAKHQLSRRILLHMCKNCTDKRDSGCITWNP